MQRARGVPSYSQLDGDAVETDLLGISVRICSLSSGFAGEAGGLGGAQVGQEDELGTVGDQIL